MKRSFYSALFSDKNNLSDKISSFKRIDGWDYMLFTNLDIKSDSWTIRKIELPNKDYIVSAKIIKWLSHKYLDEYDTVFWMDAYCLFDINYDSLLKENIKSLEKAELPLFIKKHPVRNCIYKEAVACLEARKIDVDHFEKVSKFLKNIDFPKEYGLYETNMMLKLNKHKKVIKISEEIVELIKKLSYRDQLVLTVVLLRNNIRDLQELNAILTVCNSKRTKHIYYDKDPRNVAICFFGLTRSLKFNLPSINKYIFNPLNKEKISFDIYLHTYKINGLYSNRRTGESNIKMDNNEYRMLHPDFHSIEDKDAVSKKIGLDKYRTKGNPWANNSGDQTTFDNHILYLWSIKQLTSMWKSNMKTRKYTHIILCRPDVKYTTPIEKKWLSFSSDSIFMPSFGLWHGINDRFALGRPEQMYIYGIRFIHALKYSLHNQLHSEQFLTHTLKTNKIAIEYIDMFFFRIRVGNRVEKRDIAEYKRFTLRKKAKTSKKTTRKA